MEALILIGFLFICLFGIPMLAFYLRILADRAGWTKNRLIDFEAKKSGSLTRITTTQQRNPKYKKRKK